VNSRRRLARHGLELGELASIEFLRRSEVVELPEEVVELGAMVGDLVCFGDARLRVSIGLS
jgi:hypothetical protein